MTTKVFDPFHRPFNQRVSPEAQIESDEVGQRMAKLYAAAVPLSPMRGERLVLAPHPGALKASNPKDAIGDTKVPLALCSPIAEAHWSAAQFAGMTKYGSWNWRIAGVRASVYISAMKRHIAAFVSGETHDPIDGTHHLGNVMACAAILLDAAAAGKLTDDRPPSVDVRDAYADVQALMSKLKAQYADKSPHHYTINDTEKTRAPA